MEQRAEVPAGAPAIQSSGAPTGFAEARNWSEPLAFVVMVAALAVGVVMTVAHLLAIVASRRLR